MRRSAAVLLVIPILSFSAESLSAGTLTVEWAASGEKVYETGFMHMFKKRPGGGVCLFDRELVENDAAGSGKSEKGVSEDAVWGPNRARKILYLDDPRAEKAYVVLFTTTENPSYPLKFQVNGQEREIRQTNREAYRWQEFPAEVLREGENAIEIYCPEAKSATEGWSLYLARADEFYGGGGDPTHVGETSYKSMDGGKTWKQSPFGPEEVDRCEYSVRLSLDRFVAAGWLASPVIDLWKGESAETVIPLRGVLSLDLQVEAEAPADTTVEYYLRMGFEPTPYAASWEPFQRIGEGESLHYVFDERPLNRRYVQFRAVLSTHNPLKSPILKVAHVTAQVEERTPPAENIRVVEADTPPIA